nr:EOG090X0BM0 [Eulimnadia texana]
MGSFSWFKTQINSESSEWGQNGGSLPLSLGLTSQLQFRFLSPSDKEEVKRLCTDWFPIQYPDSWYEDVTSNPRFYSLAAVCNNELVGFLIAEIKSASAIHQEDYGILDSGSGVASTVAYILSLGVCSSFRRQGVASMLLSQFLNHVQQVEYSDCQAVYLHVLTANMAAIRFYEKQNFRLHQFLPYYYCVNGIYKDGFTYVLYINGGHPPWTLLYPFSNQTNNIFTKILIFLNFCALTIFDEFFSVLLILATKGQNPVSGNIREKVMTSD